MPDADPTHYRLDDLKLRWQRDPSSRLFLQLADEHRKLSQPEQAIAVLEQGLEHRPNDLSALVLLGRCRLELERVEEAVVPLETVLSRDPTHIVASKLLIEAYLQQGDAAKAAEHLLTYRLLNDRDPELYHLEYRLRRLQSEHEQEASTVAAGELAGDLEDGAAASPGAGASLAETPTGAGGQAPPPPSPEAGILSEVGALPGEAHGEAEEGSAEAVEEAAPEVVASEVTASEVTVPEVAAPRSDEAADEELPVGLPPAAGGELFDLSGMPSPAPDFSALWAHFSTHTPAPAEPFSGLNPLDSARHWQLLSQEGIFVSPAAPAAGEVAAPPLVTEIEAPELEAPARMVAEPSVELAATAAPGQQMPIEEAVVEPVAEAEKAAEPGADEQLVAPLEEPVFATPEEPVVAAEEPSVAMPEEPTATTVEEPVFAAPEESVSAMPEAPVAAVPEEQAAMPEEPMVAMPEEPMVAMPEAPVAAMPEEPAAFPEAPVAAMPEGPVAAMPEEPMVAMPEEPMVAIPEAPVAAIPEVPWAAIPEEPAAIPEEPAAIPEAPWAAIPEEVAAIPEAPVAAIPEAPVAAIPEAPWAAVPEEPAAIPEEPAFGAPEEPVAAIPESPAGEPALAPPATDFGTSAAEPVAESATATLGQLYLKQGYEEEAERIFTQVLKQDPHNKAALEGLERLGKRRGRPLTAADLLAVRTTSGRIPEGLTAKKILILGNYVKHLRAAAQHRRAEEARHR